MPVEAFEVIVGVSAEVAKTQNTAIAEASRYLAYADHSDTFGYGGRVQSVDVYDGAGRDMDWGVGLTFTAPIENDDHLKSFMDEMVALAHVETVERVSIVEDAKV